MEYLPMKIGEQRDGNRNPTGSAISPGAAAVQARGNDLRGILRWLAVLFLPMIFCAASAFSISHFVPPVYAARTEVILHLQQSGDAVVRYLASQAVIMRSPALLGAVAIKSGLDIEQVDNNLTVEFPKSGNVMRIQYRDRNRDRALDLTQKILTQYEYVIGPIEGDESASHQVISPPALLEKPVAPQPLQLAALGGAIGLIISLVTLGWIRQSQSS